MRKVNKEMPFSMSLAPMAFMDNKFCLSSNDPAVMAFAWRKNQSADKIELQEPFLCIELPETVQIKAARDGDKQLSNKESFSIEVRYMQNKNVKYDNGDLQ